MRLVHLSPEAPAVDVAVRGGPVLLRNGAFKAASDVIEVDAGTDDLEVRPAGQSTVALAVPGVQLTAGTTASVFALGLLHGQPGLQAKAVVDAPPLSGMPSTGVGGMDADQRGTVAFIALGLVGLGAIVTRRHWVRA